MKHMKANRKYILKADEHAVSAVIGVILMVAITVAIAATVYYYVTTMMPKSSNTAPTFQLHADEVTDRLIVSSASQGSDWVRLALKSNVGAAISGDAINTVYFSLKTDVTSIKAAADWNEVATDFAALQAGPTTTQAEGWPLPIDTVVQITQGSLPMTATDYLDFEGALSTTGVGAAVPQVSFTVLDTASNQEIGTYTFTSIQATA